MKKRMLILLLIIIPLLETAAHPLGDSLNNVRSERKFGISLKLGGSYDVLGGLEIDYFLSPALNLEADIFQLGLLGNTKYYGGGINYYPFGNKAGTRLSPYIGLLAGYASGSSFLAGEPVQSFMLTIPLGINYIGKKGMNLSIDLSGVYASETKGSAESYRIRRFIVGPVPGLKVGYRF